MNQDKKLREEIGKVLDAVFLHGKETPDLSYNLPDGQTTIADAIDQILSKVKEEMLKELDDLVAVKNEDFEGWWIDEKEVKEILDRIL